MADNIWQICLHLSGSQYVVILTKVYLNEKLRNLSSTKATLHRVKSPFSKWSICFQIEGELCHLYIKAKRKKRELRGKNKNADLLRYCFILGDLYFLNCATALLSRGIIIHCKKDLIQLHVHTVSTTY